MTTTSAHAEVPTMSEAPRYELRIVDRCDQGQCGAQAFVIVDCGDGDSFPLYFCAHHYAQHEQHFAHWRVVVDARDTINEQASPSATV